MCGDAPTVALERSPTLASVVMLRSGCFGRSTSFTEFPCSSWTVRAADPYAGPWDRAMAKLLPGAFLLRVDGFGHTSLLNRSTCAKAWITG